MSTHKRSLPFDLGWIDAEFSDPLRVAERERRFVRSEIRIFPEGSTFDASFPQRVVVDLLQEGTEQLLLSDRKALPFSYRCTDRLVSNPATRHDATRRDVVVVDPSPSLTFLCGDFRRGPFVRLGLKLAMG